MLSPKNSGRGGTSIRLGALVAACLIVVILAAGLTAGGSRSAAPEVTFRFAYQGGINSLDSYTLNESFTLGTLANVMEGLIKRDADLKIVPGLATRWEVLEPTRWRFHLRKDVVFHDGSPFSADDVIFSAERARSAGSQLRTRIPADAKVVKVDDYTIDFVLASPNPILHSEWETWFIVSKRWMEANGGAKVQPASATALSPFALKANGTGPFMVTSHAPGMKTVFRPNPNYWGQASHNIGEVVFQSIHADATRVAALLSGQMDLIDPLPVQDIARVGSSGNAEVLTRPEVRTIFLNMDSMRAELSHSNVKGRNPFKDARVRRAFYHAIDVEAIKTKVLRGMAAPTSLMIAPDLFPGAGAIERWPFDPATAKQLLTAAGYPEGFQVVLDCPNDRYVNDEEICQAISGMLARIGVQIRLNVLPKAQYFAKVGPPRYDSSFNMLGWTPGSLDSWNVLANLVACRDVKGKGGTFNFGGYCNPNIDALAKNILVESDHAARNRMIGEAFRLLHEDAGMIPLHQQMLAWGVAKGVHVIQRADGHIRFAWVRKE